MFAQGFLLIILGAGGAQGVAAGPDGGPEGSGAQRRAG